MTALLTEADAADYLVRRGVIDGPAPVESLGGGVSNVVFAVGDRVVLKQSLPRLRVAEEWLAKQERALTEAAALRVAGDLAPGSVPGVLDVDPDEFTLTIERAPAGWHTWKDDLLAGRADAGVAAELGRLLGIWHRGTKGMERFDDPEAFEQLRVDPYYRTIHERHPDLANPIGRCIETMASRRACLVHGDYSPKNVMVGPRGGVWVLDFEVAHLGDPAFDVAFMLNHLLLKTIHRPGDGAAYRACADAFVSAYGEQPDEYVLAHLGCLLLARVDGKSPAEYLTDDERVAARERARSILLDRPEALGEVWPE